MSSPSVNVPDVDIGMYESLRTEDLHRQLQQALEVRPTYGSVDAAEQALAITRHLTPILERTLRAAGSAAERAALVQNILNQLPDEFVAGEAL